MKKLFFVVLVILLLFAAYYFGKEGLFDFESRELQEEKLEEDLELEDEEKEPKDHQAALEDTCKDLSGNEQDHCYQQLAWEAADYKVCGRISGQQFEGQQINPPRDKCYSMVASKLCDPTVCDMMGEGHDFFTPTTCKQRISRVCP